MACRGGRGQAFRGLLSLFWGSDHTAPRGQYPRIWTGIGLLALTVLVGCTESTPAKDPLDDPQTPKALAGAVLAALQANDLAAYRALQLRAEDGAEVVRRWAGDDRNSKFTEEWFKKYVSSRDAGVAQRFAAVRAKGDGAGFDWGKVQIANLETQNQPKGAATVTDIFVTLQVFGAAYPITIDDCIHLSRGWAIVDGVRWTKK